jgi:hypothetical protein
MCFGFERPVVSPITLSAPIKEKPAKKRATRSSKVTTKKTVAKKTTRKASTKKYKEGAAEPVPFKVRGNTRFRGPNGRFVKG